MLRCHVLVGLRRLQCSLERASLRAFSRATASEIRRAAASCNRLRPGLLLVCTLDFLLSESDQLGLQRGASSLKDAAMCVRVSFNLKLRQVAPAFKFKFGPLLSELKLQPRPRAPQERRFKSGRPSPRPHWQHACGLRVPASMNSWHWKIIWQPWPEAPLRLRLPDAAAEARASGCRTLPVAIPAPAPAPLQPSGSGSDLAESVPVRIFNSARATWCTRAGGAGVHTRFKLLVMCTLMLAPHSLSEREVRVCRIRPPAAAAACHSVHVMLLGDSCTLRV